MIFLDESEWPAWATKNYGQAELAPYGQVARIGLPEDPADREPGVYYMALRQVFNAKVARMDESSLLEQWCYPSFAEALAAMLPWNGKGNPNETWLRHVDWLKGVRERRHPYTHTLLEDED